MMADPARTQVLMVLPQARFKDEEVKTLQAFLDRRKIPLKSTAPLKKEVYGMGQARVKPDYSFDEVDVADFDAVVFIGGMGTRELWDEPRAHDIARKAFEAGKIVCAISMGPVILARAGLLDGREATVYFSETKQLTDRGARYTGSAIAVSDNIITCKGPEAVEKLALLLIKLLSERQSA